MAKLFTVKTRRIILQIPYGMVSTYGTIAHLAGNHMAARQVARVLHSSSHKFNLPWHRVVNIKGEISFRPGSSYDNQKKLLENEGIIFDHKGRIDLEKYLWLPGVVSTHK